MLARPEEMIKLKQAADQIRAGDQSEDGKANRINNTRERIGAGRSSDQ
jgi:hypothetical protein